MNPTWIHDTTHQLSFPIICWLFYSGATILVSRIFSYHDSQTPKRKSRLPHGTACFHKRHMLLLYVMLLPWFISTYMKNYAIISTSTLSPTRYKYDSNPVFRDLRNCTDEYYTPKLIRDPIQNKILMNELQAYVASPSRSTRTVYLDSDSFDVCVDSGASSTCTMNRQDFIPGTFQSLSGYTINGISAGLEVLGYGTVRWVIHDDDNIPIDVEIERSLLIKDLPMRLLSPQQLARQSGGLCDGFRIGSKQSTLAFGGYIRTIPYHAGNKLPIFSSFPGCSNFTAYKSTLVADGSEHDNLTYPQRQLLKWHRRLGHLGYHKIQQFSRMGLLPKELGTVRQTDFPVCPACQYGKQKRSYNISSLNGNSISASAHQPGDCVSIDMIHSPIGGLIPQNRGKLRTERYNYACVFVDHVT